jgi:hypothetical protein
VELDPKFKEAWTNMAQAPPVPEQHMPAAAAFALSQRWAFRCRFVVLPRTAFARLPRAWRGVAWGAAGCACVVRACDRCVSQLVRQAYRELGDALNAEKHFKKALVVDQRYVHAHQLWGSLRHSPTHPSIPLQASAHKHARSHAHPLLSLAAFSRPARRRHAVRCAAQDGACTTQRLVARARRL